MLEPRNDQFRTVYKYDLNMEEEQRIKMPLHSKIVHCDLQNGQPKLWVEVQPGHEIYRTFVIVGTGNTVPEFSNHRGTFQTGPFVFHVYEKQGYE